MLVINEYTLKVYEVYSVEVINDLIHFVVWDDFDGFQLVPADCYRPYKELRG